MAMNPERLLLITVALWLLTGMRDPFKPQPDLCQSAQLTQWHYQGVVITQHQAKGIVKDAAGTWRRVGVGEVLPAGWRIERITEEEIHLMTGAGCEPQQWQWKREGKQHEAMDSGGNHTVQHTQRAGGKTEARDAGGG